MSRNIELERLVEERKAWRKYHPHVTMMVWRCTIPGKPDTDWEGGYFPLTIYFSEDFPIVPPKCRFPPGFFHPNVNPSGSVSLSNISGAQAWSPSMTVDQILVSIQDLLDNPFRNDAAQSESSRLLIEQPDEYSRRVREQARRYPPPV